MKRKINPSRYPNRTYTFEEARLLRGPVVYGLLDYTGVFYVGRTIDAATRFRKYIRPGKTSLRLLRRIRDAGDDLRVVVLEHNPHDLVASETAWIARLGMQLANVLHNSRHMTTHVGTYRQANRIIETQLATCPRCGNENWDHGKHLCKTNRLELLNPAANKEMRNLLRSIGHIREREHGLWHAAAKAA